MSREATTIVDRASGAVIDGIVDNDMPILRLVDAEEAWSPLRFAAFRRFFSAGRVGHLPEHVHWNWARKALAFDHNVHRLFGVEAEDQLQGLTWIWLSGYRARLAPASGQPLIYVDYVETAPWNAREYTVTPRFQGVGTRLLQAAVLQSQAMGLEGRVGLHSLPQSIAFYARSCGMQCLGEDASYQNLPYFEFTSESAASLLAD